MFTFYYNFTKGVCVGGRSKDTGWAPVPRNRVRITCVPQRPFIIYVCTRMPPAAQDLIGHVYTPISISVHAVHNNMMEWQGREKWQFCLVI